jgi:mannose-6-phosphate isomerase-like protein (cupin superfamily)
MKLITEPAHGDELDAEHTMYPSSILCLKEGGNVASELSSTCYGIALCDGEVHPEHSPSFETKKGTAFALTGSFLWEPVEPTHSTLFVIERLGYRGMVGLTQIEPQGRLSYIDGCSDSLLFGPHRLGDPCLNSLHFPPGINQSFHIHPDIRVGIVLDGKGWACLQNEELPLTAGSMFILEQGERHRFRTQKEGMTVVAYHPTTGVGPTDQAHPMKDRTYIGNDR